MRAGITSLSVGQDWHVRICSLNCSVIIMMSRLQTPQSMLRLAQTMGTAPEGDHMP